MGALNDNKEATKKSISDALQMAVDFIDNGSYENARATLLAIDKTHGNNQIKK